ncbi:Uncharacterized protein Rs2_02724 [Raphanus sativus]|nr:Uncharacterized protein Rs2_02724 [Raphanus sativus]
MSEKDQNGTHTRAATYFLFIAKSNSSKYLLSLSIRRPFSPVISSSSLRSANVICSRRWRILLFISFRNWLSRRCSSLIRFGRKSDRPGQPQDLPSDSSVHSCEGKKDHAPPPPSVVDYNSEVSNRFSLKSSLKKRSFSDVLLADDDVSRDCVLDHADRRKVQWPDTCGIEIAEVREFEPSEVDESDDELYHGNRKSCMCTIM